MSLIINMSEYTILVTASGGDIGQGIIKSLRFSPHTVKILCTDITAEAPGLFLGDKGYVVPAAAPHPKEYLAVIGDLCCLEAVDMVFVCHETEQRLVAEHRTELMKKTSAYFVVQSQTTLERCMDKVRLYDYLSERGIRVPETYVKKEDSSLLIKKYGFPLVLKSRSGSGSRGFHLVKNQFALETAWSETEFPLIQEFISNKNGEEYTVGVFLDKESRALGAIPMLRQLRFGMTWHAIVNDYPGVTAAAIQAAEAVQAVGPCNVQLRLDAEGKPCIIEINARISSTTIFRAKLGFNEAVAALDYFLENKKPQLAFNTGVVMRTWDELIVPLEAYRELIEKGSVENKK